MPRGKKAVDSGVFGQLTKMINSLKAQRKTHADALRTIDSMFESIGITTHLAAVEEPASDRKPGRPAGSTTIKRGPGRPPKSEANDTAPAKKRRKRRSKFAATATETILAFVKEGGDKGRTTSEINKHWKSQGRSGDSYVPLGQLVKAKKLKRENISGERGSRYSMI